MLYLLAAKQPPFPCIHIAGRDHSHETSGQSSKNDESQTAVQRFAQCDVSLLARPPDSMVAGENLLHLIRSELVPLDMEDVVIVPFKAGNDHTVIVTLYIQTATNSQPVADQRPEGFEAVAGADFFAVGDAARVVADGHFVDADTLAAEPGGDLRAEFEAAAFEAEIFQ